ncbi:MAG: hypothetical protein ABII13_01595 [Patescibacteria group bacterium]|nr:hypothetical protein [Patescibacteria group bacterium]
MVSYVYLSRSSRQIWFAKALSQFPSDGARRLDMNKIGFYLISVDEIKKASVKKRPTSGAKIAVVASPNVMEDLALQFIEFYFPAGVAVDLHQRNEDWEQEDRLKRIRPGKKGPSYLFIMPKEMAEDLGYKFIVSIDLDDVRLGYMAVNCHTPEMEGF